MLVCPSLDASSGYLSAVDLTDSEDAGRTGMFCQDPNGPQVAVMGGSYAGLSPMIIMNNLVLNQVKCSNVCLPLPKHCLFHYSCQHGACLAPHPDCQ